MVRRQEVKVLNLANTGNSNAQQSYAAPGLAIQLGPLIMMTMGSARALTDDINGHDIDPLQPQLSSQPSSCSLPGKREPGHWEGTANHNAALRPGEVHLDVQLTLGAAAACDRAGEPSVPPTIVGCRMVCRQPVKVTGVEETIDAEGRDKQRPNTEQSSIPNGQMLHHGGERTDGRDPQGREHVSHPGDHSATRPGEGLRL